ncbi:MAG TPA: hypothetical protein PLZ32_14415 [Saprospiraceae bacterium]|nr:hypothetical protein [Saprospiraceae bacterium]
MQRWLLFKQKDLAGKVSNFLWRNNGVDLEIGWIDSYLAFRVIGSTHVVTMDSIYVIKRAEFQQYDAYGLVVSSP